MEILKRARGPSDGDITSFKDVSDKDEINRRTHKAGYTDRDGQMKDPPKIRSFGGIGKTKLNIWPRDEAGNLID